ncbi:MAG TPA: C25 family cysteine peptidase [Planctomycetota bacterium]|nr:C25 family cysteine peptidase [Planctomycetota bacterium]
MTHLRLSVLSVIVFAALMPRAAFAFQPPNGMVRVNKVTMTDSTNGGLYSAAIDPVNGYAYFGGKHFMNKINIKGAQPLTVASVAGNSQLVGLVDPAAGYCYFCAGSVVTRFSLGAGDAAPAIVDTLTMSNSIFGGVIDTSDPNPANHYLYFLLTATPCIISKVSVATFQPVASLPLNAGENNFRRGAIDTKNGYLYFCGPAAATANPSVVKVALGAGSSTPVRIGSVQLDSQPYGMGAMVIDVAHGYGYCGTYFPAAGNSTIPNVYKISLGAGNAPPSLIGLATLSAGTGALNGPDAQEREISTGVIDVTSGNAYFGCDHTYPAKIFQINLGAGNAAPVETGMLQLAGGTHALGEPNGPNDGEQYSPRVSDEDIEYGEIFHQSSVIDPTRGDPTIPGSHYAYFGCDSYSGQVTKVLLPPPASTFTWNGGDGTWAIGAGGWDLGNWTDVGNVVIGKGTDTSGTLTISSSVNPASITFNAPQSGAYTLMVNAAIELGTPVTVGSGAAIRGTGGSVNRLVQTTSTGVVWPGAASSGSAVPASGEALTVLGLDMSGGGTLKIALNAVSANSTQSLIVTGPACTLGGALSLGVPPGTASANTYTVLSSASPIAGTFSTIKLNGVVVSGASPVNVQYSANAVTIKLTGAVTPVTLEDFAAKTEGAGILLSWSAVSEFQNAGFNLFRRAVQAPRTSVSGQPEPRTSVRGWTRVNSSLIPGRISAPDLKNYSYCDWCEPGIYEYKLECVSIGGDCETYPRRVGPVELDPLVETAEPVSRENLAALSMSVYARDARSRSDASRAQFAMFASAATPQPRPPSPKGRGENGGLLSSEGRDENESGGALLCETHTAVSVCCNAAARWFSGSGSVSSSSYEAAKMLYAAPGVYFIPQTMLPVDYDVRHLAIQREGRVVAALAVLPGGMLVYGPGYNDDYTNKDALFLRKTGAETLAGNAANASGLFGGTLAASVTTSATFTREFHDVYFDYALRPLNYPPWFSSQYLSGGTAQDFSVETALPAGGTAALTLNLWSLTEGGHTLNVALNGTPLGQSVWNGGGQMLQAACVIPAGVLNDGSNTVSLITLDDGANSAQLALLHSISISYTKALDGSHALELIAQNASNQLFEISHVPAGGAWVVDARFPDRASLVATETQPQADGTLRLRFSASGGGSGRFLVVPVGQELQPLSIVKRQIKAVKACAYLATGPAQFGAAVQPMLAARSKEGLRAQFVDQEQLFDYYGYGRYGPNAIQNAVRSSRPQYLLLLGRTTYDYLNFSGNNVEPLCPTFLVSTTFWSQATSDSAFGDLGLGFPEIAVGRLPVNDESELNMAVQRILAYRGAPQSGARIHAAADRADPTTADFPAQADGLSQAFPAMNWQANYLGVTAQTSPEINANLTAAACGGADWILYVGHGNSVRLGNEAPRILDTDSVQAWTGNVVFLQSTCNANWMAKDEDGFRSIAIQALVQPQGGICASIGSSTYMNSDFGVTFMRELICNANADNQRWGTALLKAQQWAYAMRSQSEFYEDLSRTEQIFGDPAMRVFFQLQKEAPQAAADGGRF